MPINVLELADKMNRAGVPGDYGSDMSRVLNRIWKEVAKGKPVTQHRVDEIISQLLAF